MYKGEVNVQYCQLSALLKTAESLKVKGLAEMTNQNTALREPEREPDRLRPHSQPHSKSSTCESPVDASFAGPSTSGLALTAGTTTIASVTTASTTSITSTTSATSSANTSAATTAAATTISSTSTSSSTVGSKHHHHHHPYHHHPSERCSPSPPKRLHCKSSSSDQESPLPLDLYQRRIEQQQQQQQQHQDDLYENSITNQNIANEKQRSSTPSLSASGTSQKHSTGHNHGGNDESGESGLTQKDEPDDREFIGINSPVRSTSCSIHRPTSDEPMSGIEKIEDVEDVEYGDEEMDLEDDGENSCEEVGLNMKIGSGSLAAALVSPNLNIARSLESGGATIEGDSARSTPLTSSDALTSEHIRRPASQGSREPGGLERPNSRSGGLCGLPSTSGSSIPIALSPVSSAAAALGLTSSDTLAGPSGLGPVQSVPLSLKKEIDCSEDDNSSSRHLQPRSASASGILGGELDYRTSHESLLRNFGMTTRCPTPFAFPFSPLGLNLFDIDPSRILSMLHHQSWFTEEALRNRGLLTPPPTSKDFAHRLNPLSDLLSKDYHTNTMHVNTADLLLSRTSTPLGAGGDTNKQQLTQQQQHRSITQQQQYKQQPPFNIRYPSPAAFFHHQHQQQQQQQQQQHQLTQKLQKSTTRQNAPSPHQTTTLIQSSPKATERSSTPRQQPNIPENDDVVEITATVTGTPTPHHDEAAAIRDRDSGNSSAATTSSITSPMLYKDSLEQLLQRRRSNTSLIGEANLKPYSQLLLTSMTPPDATSNCKEKSSSSSTSSTPPPASGTPGHGLVKSPSDTSSLFSEPIEEETRCIVCNAHFPNVWLLEQHAALQHPILGPGDEKPFICEQCGQSYRYRSAYAKHKEQNHRARLPADKLFTCDVCGMQFRYLKSFKKHRLNHALERLHGKKGSGKHHLAGSIFAAHFQHLQDQDMLTGSQETLTLADNEVGEDLRISIKKEKDDDDQQQQQQRGAEDQDVNTDGVAVMHYNDKNNKTAPIVVSMNANEAQDLSSTDGIHSTNKRPHLLNTTTLPPHLETDPSFHHQQQRHQHHQHHHHHHHHHSQQSSTPSPASQHHSLPQHPTHHPHIIQQLPGHLAHNMTAIAAAAAVATTPQHQLQMTPQTAQQAAVTASAVAANSLNSLNSLNSITSLINTERLPNEQFLGLNPQEASILNFLRADAAERQRDKRPPASRFACPFCGKCVRSKENLKLHVRKHTGERPFVCLFCGRAFGGKSDLTRHLRIHTGERPYHCESCGKCFARADYLSKHLTTHIHNAPR
ncbi:maternal gene required for meiosis isoform 2-T16 [Glossina fuscipes fuscipes]